MPVSIYDFSIPEFQRGLYTLKHILEKAVAFAQEKGIDAAEIPGWRLTEDMLPLSSQVQIASNTSKNTIARITKAELPVWEDNEKTIEELQARIEKTLDMLKGIKAEEWNGLEDNEVIIKAGGQDRKFTALSSLQSFAIPNFFFHVSIAYAILRAKGVQIGKTDYLTGSRLLAESQA